MSTIFRQKQFSEYDAMIQLYQELKRLRVDRNIGIINTNQLISTLRGNNIVIEKFTQATRVFGKDRYRMYIKIGARAKLPDSVRLPQYSTTKSLGYLNLGFEYGIKPYDQNNQDQNNQNNNNNNKKEEKPKYNNSDSKKGPRDYIHINFQPKLDFLNYEIHKLLGEAIEYNKAERSLVLEFQTVGDAIRALNILPFGLGYNIYLLNA